MITPWPPVAGFYQIRLVAGGPFVPVRVWFGAPIVDGEELDRSPRWCCEIDGRADEIEQDKATGYRCRVPIDAGRVWPFCARWPIEEWEYRYMVEHGAWARTVPGHPKATPRKPVDFLKMRLPF